MKSMRARWRRFVAEGGPAVPSLAFVFLVLALLFPAGAVASISAGDGSWVWQTPVPQIETLRAVVFVGASEGWAAGDGGALLRTADGGKTWSARVSGTDASLRGLSFANAECGWAVGRSLDADHNPDGNAILATTDGGLTWHFQDAGVQSGLSAVTFVDRAHGWAVGDAGTILRTVDGGVTWEPRGSGTTKKLLALSSATPRAAGPSGLGHRPSHRRRRPDMAGVGLGDEGQAHRRLLCRLAARLGGRVCSSSSQSVVLATTDGGLTWHRQDLGQWVEPLAVSFSDRRHGMSRGGPKTTSAGS